jgi:hypothetical protein
MARDRWAASFRVGSLRVARDSDGVTQTASHNKPTFCE